MKSSSSSRTTSRPWSMASLVPASRRKSASWTFGIKDTVDRSDSTTISTSRQSSRSASWTFASKDLATDNNRNKQSTTYTRSNSRGTTHSSRSSSLSSLLSIPDDTQEDDLWAEFKNELEARHLKTGLGVQGMLSKFVADKKQKQLKEEEEEARRLLEEEKNLTSASVTANNRRNPLHHLRSSFSLKSLGSMDEIDQKQQKEERDPSWMLPLPGRRGSENSEIEASRTNYNNLQGTKDSRYTSGKIEEKWLKSHNHSSCPSDIGNMVTRVIYRDYLDKNVDESGSEKRNKIQMPNLDKCHSRENKNDLAKVEDRKWLSHINHSSCPSAVGQIATAATTTKSRVSSSSSSKKGECSADYLNQRNSCSYNIMARKPSDSCPSEIGKVADSSSRTRGGRISDYWDTRNSWTPSSLPASNDNNNATTQRTRKPLLQDWFRSVGERGFIRKQPTVVSPSVTKDDDKGSNHQKQMKPVASHYTYSELDHIPKMAAQCPKDSFWGHVSDDDEGEEYYDIDASDKISDQSFPPDLTPPLPEELSSREVTVTRNEGNHHKLHKKTTSVPCSKDELTDFDQSQSSCLKPPPLRLEEPSSLKVKAPSLSKTSSKRNSDDCEDNDNNLGTKKLLHLLFSMDEEEVNQAKRPPPPPGVDDSPAANETQSNGDREEDLEEKRIMEPLAELQQTIASLDPSPKISTPSLHSGTKPITPDFYNPRRKHDGSDKTNSMSSTAATFATTATATDSGSNDQFYQLYRRISFIEAHMKKSSTKNEKEEIIGKAPCTTGSISSQAVHEKASENSNSGRTEAISSNTYSEPPSLNNHGTLSSLHRRGSIALDTISTGQLLVDWGDTTGCEEDEREDGNDNNKSGMPNNYVEPCVLKKEEEEGEETVIWPCGVNQRVEDHFITLYHQDKALRRISDITTEAFDDHEVMDSYQEEVGELSTPNAFRQKIRSLSIKEELGEEESDQ